MTTISTIATSARKTMGFIAQMGKENRVAFKLTSKATGVKTNVKGEEVETFSSFVLASDAALTVFTSDQPEEALLVLLRELPADQLVPMNHPARLTGIMVMKLSSSYSGADLADVLVSHFGFAICTAPEPEPEKKPSKSKGKSKDNGTVEPIPVPVS